VLFRALRRRGLVLSLLLVVWLAPRPGVFPSRAVASPSADGALVGSWRLVTHLEAPLPADAIRFVEMAPDGTLWLRGYDAADTTRADWVAALDQAGGWRVFPTLPAAVEEVAAAGTSRASLPDLWVVDDAGRMWIGADFYVAGAWRRADTGSADLRLASRALLDPSGGVWVPFNECPQPDRCDAEGLAGFAASATLEQVIRPDPAPEAGQYGVADLHLIGMPSYHPGTPRAAWIVARRDLYLPPDTAAVAYPLLDRPAPPDPRNAGYATAAALSPDGRLTVVTWVEVHGEQDVVHRVLANTWLGGSWSDPVDLTDAPLFAAGAEFLRPVAMALVSPVGAAAAEPTLWLASSAGEIAVRRGQRWVAHFTAEALGLPHPNGIRDLCAGSAGRVYAATDHGLLVFVPGTTSVRTAYLPIARQSRR